MTTPSIPHLQDYLRRIARRENDVVSVPPFSAFCHASDPLPAFSYAIPDCPMPRAPSDSGATCLALDAPLARLAQTFTERDRWPRFEFLQEYAPGLALALESAGYGLETAQIMLCTTVESLRYPSKVPGLVLTRLGSDAPVALIQEMLAVQRRGFEGEDAMEVGFSSARRFRETLTGGRARLARLNGTPVGAGTLAAPSAGLCELRGIVTLASYRRRGIGSALTARLARDAFGLGAEVAFLSAENGSAARMYRRLAFRPVATMVAYVRAESGHLSLDARSSCLVR